jgi:thioredoxin-related protein
MKSLKFLTVVLVFAIICLVIFLVLVKSKSDESIKDTETASGNVEITQDVNSQGGSYEPYSESKINQASGKIVLFFRAPWCPTCRALDSNIKNNLSSIPKDTTILDVSYDNETELRQKYGVTYQHTLVQIDSSGNKISKWTGSPTLSSLLAQVQ